MRPRLTHRHQATCAPRRSPPVRPEAPRWGRRRSARASCSSRQSTQERCKRGGRRGERCATVKQSEQKKLPTHSSPTSRPNHAINDGGVASVVSQMLRRQARTSCNLRPCCTMRGGGRMNQAAGGGDSPGTGHVMRCAQSYRGGHARQGLARRRRVQGDGEPSVYDVKAARRGRMARGTHRCRAGRGHKRL